jgi:alpha-tubulin suppressor-like RCC1 family protein
MFCVAIPASARASTGLYGWGLNIDGQLGDGYGTEPEYTEGPELCRWGGPGSLANVGCSAVPAPVAAPTGITSVSAGEEDALGLTELDVPWGWGDNEFGQLADGLSGEEQYESTLPVKVKSSTFTGLYAVTAGSAHSVGLYEWGTLWAWGSNEVDQLGDGKTGAEEPESAAPVVVSQPYSAVAIAAGGYHTLALVEGGTVIAWGDDEYGQLGDNSFKNRDKPTTVKQSTGGTLTGVTAIAAGEDFSLALLNNGTVMAWGADASGQLGEGLSKSGRPRAYAVKNLTGVTAIAAGAEHSLALLSNGTVMAWGNNEDGQLGDGTLTNRTTPVAVHGLSDVTAIAAGGNHSMALLANGTVYTWGENEFGQLGTGSSSGPECGNREICSTLPVEVPGLTNVKTIAAGYQDSFAIGTYTPSEVMARRAAAKPAHARRPARAARCASGTYRPRRRRALGRKLTRRAVSGLLCTH